MASCLPALVQSIPTDRSALVVKRYTRDRQKEWDEFIGRARNGTFLFNRGYMEYHADRFLDHSLMIFQGGQLAAVLPANLDGSDVLASHDGLTYGGLVVPSTITLTQTMACFHAVLRELHGAGVELFRYKYFPLYYSQGSEDDLSYSLFLLGARLYRRDCSLAVPCANRLPFQKRRLRQAKKALRARFVIRQDLDFCAFWEHVLIPRLASRYGVRPVHTLAEITLLAARFGQNIKQFSVYDGAEILAGMTIYETRSVAHAQYIAATDRGRKLGALDLLVDWLLNNRYQDKKYFDFGASNEPQRHALNHGLLEWKEGFGARSFALDQYEIQTANYVQLEPPMIAASPVPSKATFANSTAA
jgi:hypothetical protein